MSGSWRKYVAHYQVAKCTSVARYSPYLLVRFFLSDIQFILVFTVYLW